MKKIIRKLLFWVFKEEIEHCIYTSEVAKNTANAAYRNTVNLTEEIQWMKENIFVGVDIDRRGKEAFDCCAFIFMRGQKNDEIIALNHLSIRDRQELRNLLKHFNENRVWLDGPYTYPKNFFF